MNRTPTVRVKRRDVPATVMDRCGAMTDTAPHVAKRIRIGGVGARSGGRRKTVPRPLRSFRRGRHAGPDLIQEPLPERLAGFNRAAADNTALYPLGGRTMRNLDVGIGDTVDARIGARVSPWP